MKRELNTGTKKYTKVVAIDERGTGNANHVYVIEQVMEEGSDQSDKSLGTVKFQNGPIKENGVNGIHNEDLIVIVIDRLQGFQAGEYNCHANGEAIKYLEDALISLRKRTEERRLRGVEGTSTK